MSAGEDAGAPAPAPQDRGGTASAVRSLLRAAARAYEGDAVAGAVVGEHLARLDEPLRVAVAGLVKAGKSTLVNALVGEEIAPTDAGECTRVVTWYRHGPTPRVVLHREDGSTRPLPVERSAGRLLLGLGGSRPQDVERLVVDWPARRLARTTLVDTPGLGSASADVSARSAGFLAPDDAPPRADAVLYLVRHLHATDVRALEALRDTSAGRSSVASTIAVLSRADEIGAGRLDALISAGRVAERYRRDPTVRGLCQEVVPVAGLLAQSAGTLRQAEFAALRQLARTGRDDLELQLLSADRFRAEQRRDGPSGAVRAALLERFGVFGVRLAVTLLRGGVDDPTALSRDLARRSGLDELRRLLRSRFAGRSEQLKARTALAALARLLHERPPPAGGPDLARELERVQAGAHDLRELALLAVLRGAGTGLPDDAVAEAERLVGGRGSSVPERLGAPDEAPPEQLRAIAVDAVHRWRARSQGPLLPRAAVDACGVVVRSAEGLVAATAGAARCHR